MCPFDVYNLRGVFVASPQEPQSNSHIRNARAISAIYYRYLPMCIMIVSQQQKQQLGITKLKGVWLVGVLNSIPLVVVVTVERWCWC